MNPDHKQLLAVTQREIEKLRRDHNDLRSLILTRKRSPKKWRSVGGGGGARDVNPQNSDVVLVELLKDVPANNDSPGSPIAGSASSAGRIVGLASPRRIELSQGGFQVEIAGVLFDFSNASPGEIVQPASQQEISPLVTLANPGGHRIYVGAATRPTFLHAYDLGAESGSGNERWFEIVPPLDLRTLRDFDASKSMSLGFDADADPGTSAIRWQEDGPCNG